MPAPQWRSQESSGMTAASSSCSDGFTSQHLTMFQNNHPEDSRQKQKPSCWLPTLSCSSLQGCPYFCPWHHRAGILASCPWSLVRTFDDSRQPTVPLPRREGNSKLFPPSKGKPSGLLMHLFGNTRLLGAHHLPIRKHKQLPQLTGFCLGCFTSCTMCFLPSASFCVATTLWDEYHYFYFPDNEVKAQENY